MRVLVSAASEHGATGEIAEAIGRTLRERSFDVAVIAAGSVDAVEAYDAVVLGSAVYAGHWLKSAKDLVEREAAALATRPVWLFSSGPVGDPSRKLVKKMGEDPVDLPALLEATGAREHRMFAGKLEPRALSRPQRLALKLFRLRGDFREWDAIEAWAIGIADSLERRA